MGVSDEEGRALRVERELFQPRLENLKAGVGRGAHVDDESLPLAAHHIAVGFVGSEIFEGNLDEEDVGIDMDLMGDHAWEPPFGLAGRSVPRAACTAATSVAPNAAPQVSVAQSSTSTVRPGTKDWWNSSVAP